MSLHHPVSHMDCVMPYMNCVMLYMNEGYGIGMSESYTSHCNTLQHTATHCNTLQHTATHCNTLQHTAKH